MDHNFNNSINLADISLSSDTMHCFVYAIHPLDLQWDKREIELFADRHMNKICACWECISAIAALEINIFLGET